MFGAEIPRAMNRRRNCASRVVTLRTKQPTLEPWSVGFELPLLLRRGASSCPVSRVRSAPSSPVSTALLRASDAPDEHQTEPGKVAPQLQPRRWRLRLVGLCIGYALPAYASACIEFIISHFPQLLHAALAGAVLLVAAQRSGHDRVIYR